MAGYVTIDLHEIHELARDIRSNADVAAGKAEEIIAVAGHQTVAIAQTLAPVDTGTLKNSIGVDVDGLSFEAGPTVEYGGYVEEGTDPHAIPGAFGYGPDFGTDPDFHPGTAPQPYLGPAFDQVEPVAVKALARLAEGILD